MTRVEMAQATARAVFAWQRMQRRQFVMVDHAEEAAYAVLYRGAGTETDLRLVVEAVRRNEAQHRRSA